MRFAIWQNCGKGSYLQQRLVEQGHTVAETVDRTDVLIVDCDWAWAHPRPELIRLAKQAGAKVAVYPHGGAPTVFVYDGLTPPDENVDLRLEHGRGPIEIAQLLGLELKQKETGWLFSPARPFEPVENPVRLLFAPQHPNMEMVHAGTNGHDSGPKLNQAVYKDLLKLGYELTVTSVGPLWKNGVWAHPGVAFVDNPNMEFQQSFALVQQADVVVGAGSVAAAAIASGKPTVMLGQTNLADYVNGSYCWPNNTDLYADLLRYPLDVEYGELDELIVAACDGDDGAAEWRDRFVGDDGTLEAIRLLEQLVENRVLSSTASVIIDGVTARATGIGG